MRWLVLFVCFAGCGGVEGAPPGDLAIAANPDSGGKPFGAACTVSQECATGTCFMGGMSNFCTMPCTAATQATDCPAPPTSGTCNMRGFCKP
jgi:hypothetical protein